MDRYYTVMIVPERERGVHSFRIPRIAFRAILFLVAATGILLSVMIYDYVHILGQIYENKHLSIENSQLKEQVQLFQMKMNSLSGDLHRIEIFEKKLRMITGLGEVSTQSIPLAQNPIPQEYQETINPENLKNLPPDKPAVTPQEPLPSQLPVPGPVKESSDTSFFEQKNPQDIMQTEEFINLKKLYEKKIAAAFGLQSSYEFTKEWTELSQNSFALAESFALIDYQFLESREIVGKLEEKINQLDTYLLDRTSILNSTPTLLPAKGWLTSYFGPRMSPYSYRIKMHEGLDVGAPIGTPIYSPADGVITYSGTKTGFGNTIQIDHGYGIETIYAHANSLAVRKGQPIKRGELIAQVGNTGYSTGPHLHYEIRVNGIPVDPLYYILD